MPKITVLTPTYNAERHIEACLLSVANQTYQDKEHLIIDGQSTDRTLEIVKKYAEIYSHITVVSEKDEGIYDAMNKGIDLAKGDWINFLGCDDVLYKDTVFEEIFSIDEVDLFDVLYGNVIWGNSGKIYDGRFSLLKLMDHNICHQAIFYSKPIFDKLGKFNTKYKTWADWLFNINCFAREDIRSKYVDTIVAQFAFGGQSSQMIVDTDFLRDKSLIYSQNFPPEYLQFIERLEHLELEIKEKNYQLNERECQIADLQQAVTGLNRHIDTVMASLSWRITAPLRWIGRLASGIKVVMRHMLGTKPWPVGSPRVSQGFGGEPLKPPPRTNYQPLISVIMPVYNACRSDKSYFIRALESISRQTYHNIELIIVDDGSTDNTRQVFEEFIEEHSDLKAQYFYKENGGQSSARNFGVKNCNGEYVGFLDQDDEWFENKLQTVVSWLENPNIDMLYTDADVIDGDDRFTHRQIHQTHHMGWPHPKESVEDILFKDIFVMPGLMTIRKELFERVGGFDEHLSGYEDDDLFLRLYENGRVFYLPQTTLRWRIYGDNYSFSHRMLTSRLHYWRKLLENYTDNGADRFRVQMISQRFFWEFINQAILQYENGNTLYEKSLIGAREIMPYLPMRQRLIFTSCFLLTPQRLIYLLSAVSRFMNKL